MSEYTDDLLRRLGDERGAQPDFATPGFGQPQIDPERWAALRSYAADLRINAGSSRFGDSARLAARKTVALACLDHIAAGNTTPDLRERRVGTTATLGSLAAHEVNTLAGIAENLLTELGAHWPAPTEPQTIPPDAALPHTGLDTGWFPREETASDTSSQDETRPIVIIDSGALPKRTPRRAARTTEDDTVAVSGADNRPRPYPRRRRGKDTDAEATQPIQPRPADAPTEIIMGSTKAETPESPLGITSIDLPTLTGPRVIVFNVGPKDPDTTTVIRDSGAGDTTAELHPRPDSPS